MKVHNLAAEEADMHTNTHIDRHTLEVLLGERMMGEGLFYLSHLHQEGEMKVTLVLEPRSNISVSMLNGAANDVLCLRIWNCQPLIYYIQPVNSNTLI